MGYCSSEEETSDAIDNFYDMFDYLLDTHTAVAVSAYYNYTADTEDESKTVIVSTASPYKFAADVYESLTQKRENDSFKAVKKLSNYTGVEIPEQIAELNSLPILHDTVIDKSQIKETIFKIYRD